MEEIQKITGIGALRVIAWLFLITGIILGLKINSWVDDFQFPEKFAFTFRIVGLIAGVTCWAFLLVICTIAESLVQLREKLVNTNSILEQEQNPDNNSEEEIKNGN